MGGGGEQGGEEPMRGGSAGLEVILSLRPG